MDTFQDLIFLYIDVDTQRREKYAQLIRNHGHRVFTVNDTAQAYDLYRTHKIDMIIIDFSPLNEGGVDFIRHLRQMGRDIPIIITTAYADKELLLSAMNFDISRYLIQPFDDRTLLDAILIASKRIASVQSLTFVKLQDGFSYELINKSVNRPDGSVVALSKKEYRFLELLLENRGKIIPYDTIESIIWHNSSMSIDALRTLVRGIRKKTYKNIILNHNATGYKIDF